MPKLGTPTIITAADGLAVPSRGTNVLAVQELFNETTFDRLRNNTQLTLLASALRSATTTTPDQINHNARGVMLFLDITARTVGASPTIAMNLRGIDPISGGVINITSSGNFDPVVNLHWAFLYPATLDAAVGSLGGRGQLLSRFALPRSWHVRIQEVNNITDLTYSLAACLIL